MKASFLHSVALKLIAIIALPAGIYAVCDPGYCCSEIGTDCADCPGGNYGVSWRLYPGAGWGPPEPQFCQYFMPDWNSGTTCKFRYGYQSCYSCDNPSVIWQTPITLQNFSGYNHYHADDLTCVSCRRYAFEYVILNPNDCHSALYGGQLGLTGIYYETTTTFYNSDSPPPYRCKYDIEAVAIFYGIK